MGHVGTDLLPKKTRSWLKKNRKKKKQECSAPNRCPHCTEWAGKGIGGRSRLQLSRGLQSIAADPGTRPHGTELPQNQSWGIVNPTDVMGTAEKDGQEQGQSRVTGTRGTNTAPSATAVRGTAGPKPLPLLPKLSLFSQRGWLGTLSETCRGGEGIGGTPGGRGGAEKRAEPHRGAASHPKK